jgi:hypothetical protein
VSLLGEGACLIHKLKKKKMYNKKKPFYSIKEMSGWDLKNR